MTTQPAMTPPMSNQLIVDGAGVEVGAGVGVGVGVGVGAGVGAGVGGDAGGGAGAGCGAGACGGIITVNFAVSRFSSSSSASTL